jgi:pimeloyl-ACP methyl ester carboxylesterase
MRTEEGPGHITRTMAIVIRASNAEVAYVVAPDLPGFGLSDVLETTTFDSCASAVAELLDHLGVRERFINLHDFGAPVGFRIAMDHPELVRGLIVQSANAHLTGLGPQWKKVMEYWSHPDAKNEAAATAHLTLEGVRSTYVRGLPDDVARKSRGLFGKRTGESCASRIGWRLSAHCFRTMAGTSRGSGRFQITCGPIGRPL